MAAFSNSLVHFSSGACLKPSDRSLGSSSPTSMSFNLNHVRKVQYSSSKRALKVQAEYSSDGGKQNNANFFFGGFVLGGLIVGTLGCVYAPQISKALAGADRKDLMRKLPKFIYDEEKALEKTRKILAQKIDQLNSAIDDVSSQLRSDDSPDEADDVANGLAINTDEVEAAI